MKSNFLKLGGLLLGGAMFAMIGCTDFQEDIDQVAGDVESVKAELTKLQGELTAAKAEIEDLAKLENEVAGLKTKQSSLETSLKAVETSVNTINSALSNKLDKTALDAAVATVNASITQINTTIAGLQSSLTDYAKKSEVESVQTTLKALVDAAQKAADDAKAVAEGAKAVADKATTDLAALNTTVGALRTDVNAVTTNLGSLTTRVEKAESALETLQKESAKLAYVNEQLELKADKTALDEANAAIKEIEESLKDIKGDVFEAVNGVIQSLIFVPEYTDFAATAYDYTLFAESINDNVTVDAIFQVTPKALASKFGGENPEFELKVAAQTLATRAVDGTVNFGQVKVKEVGANGRIKVDVVFPRSYFSAPFSNPGITTTSIVAYAVNKGAEVDVLTDVASTYVPVYGETVELSNAYGLYKGTTAYSVDNHEAQWSDAPAAYASLNGYEVKLDLPKGLMTIAEAAKYLNVLAADITPKYKDEVEYTYTDPINGGNAVVEDPTDEDEKCKAQIVTNLANSNAYVRTISINGSDLKVADAKNYVGHKVAVEGYFYFGTAASPNKVIEDVKYSYYVGNRKLSVDIAGGHAGKNEIAWSYNTLMALSENKTAYNKPIDKVFDTDFRELPVEFSQPVSGEIDFESIIDGDTEPTRKVVLNGTEISGSSAPKLTIDPKAAIIAKVAEVSISKGYDFPTSRPNLYKFTNSYVNQDTYTEVEFKYALTLGTRPDKWDVTVNVGNLEYAQNGVVAPLELIEAANAVANLGTTDTQFEDLTTGWANSLTLYYTKTANANKLTGHSVDLSLDELNVPESALLAISNKKATKGIVTRKYNTWCNIPINYTVNFNVVMPTYALETYPTYVSNGKVDVEAEVVATTNKYTVDDSDMAQYFYVADADDKNTITVKFAMKAVNGQPAITSTCTPELTTAAVEVDEKGYLKFNTAVLKWNTYTGTAVQVEATLYMNGNTYGPKKTITLVTQDPIVVNCGDITVSRSANADTPVNPLDNVTITAEGVLYTADVYNNGRAEDLAAGIEAIPVQYTKYGDSKIVAVEKEPFVYYKVGANKMALSSEAYTWQNGILTLLRDDATLRENIYADFEIVLDYTLDGEVPSKGTVTVTFKPAE